MRSVSRLYRFVGLPALELKELSDCFGRTTQGEGVQTKNCIKRYSTWGVIYLELYFWASRSMHDIIILDCYKIVENIINGRMIPEYKYKVNNNMRKLCY